MHDKLDRAIGVDVDTSCLLDAAHDGLRVSTDLPAKRKNEFG